MKKISEKSRQWECLLVSYTNDELNHYLKDCRCEELERENAKLVEALEVSEARLAELEESADIQESIRLINVNRIHIQDTEIGELRKALEEIRDKEWIFASETVIHEIQAIAIQSLPTEEGKEVCK